MDGLSTAIRFFVSALKTDLPMWVSWDKMQNIFVKEKKKELLKIVIQENYISFKKNNKKQNKKPHLRIEKKKSGWP